MHCSGLTHINALGSLNNYGVFWPIQSFSNNLNFNFKEIPVCIEANTEENLRIIEHLALKISGNVLAISSDKRKYLHLAAVFANNFANHMFAIAEDIALKNNVDFNLLKPLIFETANKINCLNPAQSQTGPAIRRDINTINEHLTLLKTTPVYRQLYELISFSIGNIKND